MATGRKRKQRQRHTDALDYLNGINRDSPRVARKRRQTTPHANVYDIPDSPEKPAEDPAPSEVTSLADGPQTQDNDRPAQEASESDSERGSVSKENEQSDQAPASSEHGDNENDAPEPHGDTAEEEQGDPLQGQLDLFEDANEVLSASRESLPPGAQRERSSDSGSDESEPESGNQPAVVIHSHGSEHQAAADERDDQDDNSSNPDDSSISETPQARPSQSSPRAHTLAEENDDDFCIQADEQSAQDGSTGHEHEEAHVSSVESIGDLLDQTQNESEVDDSIRELRTWFLKEIDGSTLEESWRTLYCEGRGLRRYRSEPMPDYLQGSRRLISKMRELYKEITQSEEFSYLQAKQLRNFRESIYADVRQTFEYASEKMEDATVLDQFEAHLIPRMVPLVEFSFRTFTIRGRSAADQLYETLDLVLRCSVRINDYRKAEYLPAHARSRSLHKPLKRLKAAFRSGNLDVHLPVQAEPTQAERQPLKPLTQIVITPSMVPWTQKEEEALLDGLQQYTGEQSLYVPLFPHSWFDSSVQCRR